MAKRAFVIFIICLCLFVQAPARGILYYYSGTMESTFEIEDIFTIIVPSGLTSLAVTVTLPEEYSLPNNTQNITGYNFTYSGTPSVEDYTDLYESHFRKLVWTNPPNGIITISISYTVSTTSDWSQSVTGDVFPFDSSGLPESITMFLEPSDKVQSDHPYFTDLAATLTNGLTTQWEALTVLNGWIMDNIIYGQNPIGTDAYSTFITGFGNCSNYAHIALALVRAAGIPARLTHGYSLTKPYSLPTGGEPIEASWGQGTHAWIEVYYPSLGWVPYDPQRDLHHVDTHRVLWGRGADTTGIVGRISWTFGSVPSAYPAVSNEINVNWVDDSIDLSYIKSTGEINDFSLSSVAPFIQDHTVFSSADSGGRILPDGEIAVIDGASQIFTITPDYGYKIADVLVDDISQGTVSSYTFSNLTEDHTISVQFLPDESHTPASSGSSCLIDTIRF